MNARSSANVVIVVSVVGFLGSSFVACVVVGAVGVGDAVVGEDGGAGG
jgi:hypothetical protein